MPNHYRFSYWEQTSVLARAEVCIIGAGLTGLHTALALKQRKPDCDILVVDRGPFSKGASTRNAGFACFGSPTELLEDLSLYPAERVWRTVQQRYKGIQKLQTKFGSAANYQQHGGYEIIDNQATYAAVIAALPELNAALFDITGQRNVWQVVKEVAGVKQGQLLFGNRLEGQLHPGLLVQHLQGECHRVGIRMMMGLEVTELEEKTNEVHLQIGSAGALAAQQVVVATNAFTPQLLPEIVLEPARNQVLITEPIPGLALRGCFHQERGYVYFRNVGPDRILIGGARHLAKEAEATAAFGEQPYLLSYLQQLLRDTLDFSGDFTGASQLPEQPLAVAQSWSGIIAQGGDKSPIIKRLSSRTLVAVRLAGMGVALSAQVGDEVAAMV
ncbi:MAG: FAD-dependent oxidoreductase [Bacteroidota bacterium]